MNSTDQEQDTQHRSSSSLPLQNERKHLSSIHTFKHDAYGTIREQDASLTRIHLTERKKEENQRMREKMNSSSHSWIIILILFVLAVGIAGGLYFFFSNPKQETIIVESAYHPQTLLEYDDVSSLHLDDNLRSVFLDEVDKNKSKNIGFTEIKSSSDEKVTLADVLKTLGIDAPYAGLWANTEDYMFGFINQDNSKKPFLIFKHNQKNTLIASMLNWEDILYSSFGFFSRKVYIQAPTIKFYDIGTSDTIIRAGREGDVTKIIYAVDSDKVIIATDKKSLERILEMMK